MIFQFASCQWHPYAKSFLQKMYPDQYIEDQRIPLLVSLIDRDILRIQDPNFHSPCQIVQGKSYKDSNATEVELAIEQFKLEYEKTPEKTPEKELIVIDYSKLPRLAELCRSIADDSLTVQLTLDAGKYSESDITLNIFCYEKDGKLGLITFSSMSYNDHPIGVEEMIALLEQIEHYGFREMEKAA